MNITYPETPAGKRTVRQNIYGNWVGYVSGRRFYEFGVDGKTAAFWAAGNTLERSYCDCWIEEK